MSIARREFAIICMPGFRQWAGPNTGIHAIYDQLCETYHDRRRSLVLLRTWDADARETAHLIHYSSPRKIIAIGYSYGCGWGVTQLARQLGVLGHAIDVACLIDPVPRYVFVPAKVISLTRLGAYVAPCNVRQVYSWRQVNDSPYGRRVEAQCPKETKVFMQTVFGSADNLADHGGGVHILDPGASHLNIDDNARIRDDVMAIVAKTIREVQS